MKDILDPKGLYSSFLQVTVVWGTTVTLVIPLIVLKYIYIAIFLCWWSIAHTCVCGSTEPRSSPNSKISRQMLEMLWVLKQGSSENDGRSDVYDCLMSFLTAVTTTAVTTTEIAPTTVILPVFTWNYLNIPKLTLIYLNLP